jgi:hypothetical protein
VQEKRACTLAEKTLYRAFARQQRAHESTRLILHDQMNNFTAMRDLVDAKRNNSELASVAMAELAQTLEEMSSNPLDRAKESAKRDVATSRIISQHLDAQAIVDNGEGPKALRKVFEEERNLGGLEERAEEDAIDEEAKGVAKEDTVDAIFRRASQQQLDESLHQLDASLSSLPMPAVQRSAKTTTKAGNTYAQLEEMEL